MKHLLVICVLAAILISLQAAPMRNAWFELVQAQKLLKGVGDIWSDCSKASDPAKIISVVINPDPPQSGKPISITANVNLTEQVTGGSLKVAVKFGIIPVFDKTFDLCDLAKQAGLSCPVSTGAHTAKITEDVPSIPISGHITGNAEATDQNGKELACIKIDFHI